MDAVVGSRLSRVGNTDARCDSGRNPANRTWHAYSRNLGRSAGRTRYDGETGHERGASNSLRPPFT